MSGQKLFGVPIIVQPTMAEKNRYFKSGRVDPPYPLSLRLAAAAQNLKKAEGPKKLYVGSLHYNISESMLKGIFEPFGQVSCVLSSIAYQYHPCVLSGGKGYCHERARY